MHHSLERLGIHRRKEVERPKLQRHEAMPHKPSYKAIKRTGSDQTTANVLAPAPKREGDVKANH